MPRLSDETRKEIIAALRRVGAENACSRCGHQKFSLMDGYFSQPIQEESGGLVIGGPTVPSVVVVCDRCGFIAQHAIGVLGLFPREDSGEEGSDGE